MNAQSTQLRLLQVLAFVLLLWEGAVAGQEQVLDLTNYKAVEEPNKSEVSFVLPDIDSLSRRSHDGRAANERILPVPPLSITLVSATVTQERLLTVNVRVRNDGQMPYLLPISIDPGRKSLKPGEKGRRIMDFRILISQAGNEVSEGLRTDGAETVAGSLLELRPSTSVVIRFNVRTASVSRGPRQRPNSQIQVRASIQESLLDDAGSNTYKSIAGEVRSENSLGVTVR
jgi:hypothetical protein